MSINRSHLRRRAHEAHRDGTPVHVDPLDLLELLDMLDRAEAQIEAVQRLTDQATENHARTIPIHRVRRLLTRRYDGSPMEPCGRGPCCLGSGHDGDCRL